MGERARGVLVVGLFTMVFGGGVLGCAPGELLGSESPRDAGHDASRGDASVSDGGAPQDAGQLGADAGTDAGPPPPPRIVAYTGSGARRGAAADRGALNIGHQITVARDITVRDLGVWDEGANGLARSHAVTLFSLDALGPSAVATPIAGGSVVVPAGDAAELEDGFRFAALATPIVLRPGSYAVIAYGLGPDDAYGDGGDLPVSSSGVTHGPFVPFEFVDRASPAYPVGGDQGALACASFRFENGGAAPLRILPIGDSITYGAGGSNAGYRSILHGLLTEAGLSFQFVGTAADNPGTLPREQTHHEGHPGWVITAGTSGRSGLSDHIAEWLGPSGVRPDVILLMIGTNDVALDYDLANAEARLDALVTRMIDRDTGLAPGARLVLAQLTPITEPTGDARARTYNERVAAIAARHREAGDDVTLVDMHTPLGAADMADALHPNDAGFRKMAAVWRDALLAR